MHERLVGTRPRTVRGAGRATGRRTGGNGQPVEVQDPGCLERYAQYGREVAPHLERVGATVLYAGGTPSVVIGDGERPWWDSILIVQYPTPQAFIDMVTTQEYAEVHEHRAAALERGDLIATSTWSIATE